MDFDYFYVKITKKHVLKKIGKLNLGKLKSRSQNEYQNKENPSFSREKI